MSAWSTIAGFSLEVSRRSRSQSASCSAISVLKLAPSAVGVFFPTTNTYGDKILSLVGNTCIVFDLFPTPERRERRAQQPVVWNLLLDGRASLDS